MIHSQGQSTSDNRIRDLILGNFFAQDFNKVVELSFDLRVMDIRSLVLILYSRSRLDQDLQTSKEYKYFKEEFQDNDWVKVIDRFHIKDSTIQKDLDTFINSI